MNILDSNEGVRNFGTEGAACVDTQRMLQRLREEDPTVISDLISIISSHPPGGISIHRIGLGGDFLEREVVPALFQYGSKNYGSENPVDLELLSNVIRLIFNLVQSSIDADDGVRAACVPLTLSIRHCLSCSDPPTAHDERCLELLARWFCCKAQPCNVPYPVATALLAQIDVWRYCFWWASFLSPIPACGASRIKHTHALLLQTLCEIDVADGLAQGVIAKLMNDFADDDCYTDVALTVIKNCAELQEVKRPAAIRAGVFQLAWKFIEMDFDFGDEAYQQMCHRIMAWCYPFPPLPYPPQSGTCSSDMVIAQFRRMLIHDTDALEAVLLKLKTSEWLEVKSWFTSSKRTEVWDYGGLLRDVYMHVHAAPNRDLPSTLKPVNFGLNFILSKHAEAMDVFTDDHDEFDVEQERKGETNAWQWFQNSMPLRCLFTLDTQIVNFRNKSVYLRYLMRKISESKGEHDRIHLCVPRSNVTDGVCEALGLSSGGRGDQPPAGNIEITFDDEMGQDQGGLRRAWFEAAANHFIRSDLFYDLDEDAAHLSEPGTFASQRRPGNHHWTPAPVPVCHQVQADWPEHFCLLGAILAYALLNGEVLPLKFSSNFLSLVLQRKMQVSSNLDALIEELARIDKVLAAKVRCLKEGDYMATWQVDGLTSALEAAGLRQSFVLDVSRDPELTGEIDLKPNGSECTVTEANKNDYLKLLAEHHLEGAMAEQAKYVRHGLWRVLCPNILESLAELDSAIKPDAYDVQFKDLEIESRIQAEVWFLLRFSLVVDGSKNEAEKLFCGADINAEDVKQWKRTCKLIGFRNSDSMVKWFWEIVKSFCTEEQAQLLMFTSGSSALPHEGLTTPFTLRKVSGGPNRLPVAHTCEFSLDVPVYGSKAEFQNKLRLAMKEEHFALI